MRHVGTLALFVGIFGALFGIAYSAFVLLRGWTLLTEQPLAIVDSSTVRFEAKARRAYWADIELRGISSSKSIDHDIAVKATVIDASNTVLRAVDVHLDASSKLPVCTRHGEPDVQCGEVRLDGPSRDRITMQLRVPPVIATTDGDLTYVIDVGPNARGDVTIERAKLTVYRSSREEVIHGLIAALVALVIGGIAFRLAARRE